MRLVATACWYNLVLAASPAPAGSDELEASLSPPHAYLNGTRGGDDVPPLRSPREAAGGAAAPTLSVSMR